MNDPIWKGPTTIVFILPASFLIIAYLAISLDHIKYYSPYISYLSVASPEKCIFPQICHTVGIWVSFGCYFRYLEVKYLNRRYFKLSLLKRFNQISFSLAVIMVWGLSTLSSFPAIEVHVLHVFGASSFYFAGFCYFFFQTLISYYMVPVASSWTVCNIRMGILLSIFAISNLMSFTKLYSIYIDEWGTFMNQSDLTDQVSKSWLNVLSNYWEDRKKIPFDFTTAVLEWIISILFCIYFVTLSSELKQATIYHPRVVFKSPEIENHVPEQELKLPNKRNSSNIPKTMP